MLRLLQETIETRRLLRPGEHVLLAVSGGADSVAMAYALHYLSRRIPCPLSIAHLNHGIRGRAAEQDAVFVSELAWRLGLPCIQGSMDVPRWARENGISLEMAAREARYDFLVRAAKDAGAGCIATGHTSDDQVETVLLRLARGTGPQGLAGIAYESRRGDLRVIRPLRDVTHRQAVEFLRRHRLSWREDASNRSPAHLRNRVRHEILPLFESRLNPQFRRALLRTADLLRDESEWLDALTQHLLRECATQGGVGPLRVERLGRHPVGARRRVLREWLKANGLDADAVDFDAIENIEKLLRAPRGMRSTSLAGRWRVVRRYHELVLEKSAAAAPSAFRVRLAVPGETILPEQGLRIVARWDHGVVRQLGGRVGVLPAEGSLGADAIRRSPVYVRSWKPGDRIRPLGLDGSRKLQDLFVDQKVPRDRRASVPIFECRGEVVWVPGYRVARGWEVKDPSGPCLRISVLGL